jgi:hypothetical protein
MPEVLEYIRTDLRDDLKLSEYSHARVFWGLGECVGVGRGAAFLPSSESSQLDVSPGWCRLVNDREYVHPPSTPHYHHHLLLTGPWRFFFLMGEYTGELGEWKIEAIECPVLNVREQDK